ncbi:MAG: ABC transporter permease [Candidatus Omnitrophica bacterium]|nr:ABC transporter permease [Candidatus Omnitrophota bacterium]
MPEMFKELIQYREVLFALTWRDIKIRHKQTIMGFLWVIFMPMVVVLSGIVVKKAMAMFSGRPLELSQIVSVSVKALPWAFFVASIKFSVNSLVGNMSLLNKIYFPREIFPLSALITQLFDFTIAISVLTVILTIAKIGIGVNLLWLPLLLLLLILFTAGLGLILSCANLFFRDVKYIVDVILTFGIFFTPVFYEAKMLGKLGTVLLLNPVGALLENINNVVVLHQPPDYLWLAYSAVWAVGGFFGAWFIFHKTEPIFAENV